MSHPAAHVFGYHMVGYRRTWRSSVFSTFVLPVMFLAAIGIGLGGYVNRTGALGTDYVGFLAPGVLASTALGVAVAESTYRVYAQFEWDRTYEAMLATPVRVVDLLAGQLAFVAFRVLVSAAVFLAVMAAFGAVRSPLAPLVLPVAVLLGLACATPTFAFTGLQRTEGGFAAYQRFAVVPLQLFSGVFFPIAQLPAWLRPLAWLSPLWHGVELCRGFTLGHPSWLPAAGHLAYLLLWATAGFLLSWRIFRRRLAD